MLFRGGVSRSVCFPRFALFGLLLAASLLLPGGPVSAQGAVDVGGTVIRGPVLVPLGGVGEPVCAPYGYIGDRAGTLVRAVQRGRVVAATRTDELGNFSLKLRPGAYALEVQEGRISRTVRVRRSGLNGILLPLAE